MQRFWDNHDAVLDLPMRLTVAVIIGSVALAAILGYILNPCLFPGKMMVSVNPMLGSVVEQADGTAQGNVLFTVTVTDTNGRPITAALVVIKGLGGIISGNTGTNGQISLTITGIRLAAGVYEGYLDVDVKASCFESFSQRDMIKIIRSSP